MKFNEENQQDKKNPLHKRKCSGFKQNADPAIIQAS
jgi:hypothetical protein